MLHSSKEPLKEKETMLSRALRSLFALLVKMRCKTNHIAGRSLANYSQSLVTDTDPMLHP